MAQEIILKIVMTVVSFVVTGVLGYFVGKVKEYRKKIKDTEDKILKEIQELRKEVVETKTSQLMDMKSDLSNKFFVYDTMEQVDDYLVEGFREKCERYFELGGDSWVHPMYDKSFKWKIKQTGYLK